MRNDIYIIEEAEIEMHRAEEDLEYARSETQRAHEEMEFAITESKYLRDQYKDMIVEAKEGGYFDEEVQAIKEEAQAIKEEALEQNKVVQETEAVFNAVKIREKTAQEVYEAKKRCYEQIVAIFNTEKE